MSFWSWLKPSARRIRRTAKGRLRVLVELASFDKGGLEKVVLDSALAFDRSKFEVTVVTAGKVGHWGEVARRAGLTVVSLPAKGRHKAYARLLDDWAPDVTMSHFSDVGYTLFSERDIPNITFIHNVYAFFSEQQAQAFADNDRYVWGYVSVSNNATRYAVERLGIDASKIQTIPNGLNVAEHEARMQQPRTLTREALGLSKDDYVFANVASYNLHKGHYVMADAMRQLLNVRRDVKILCVGNVVYPPHMEQLEAYVTAHGLSKHMLFPGYFEEVADVHAIADAFLLPSFIEGWSIAMNEAMFYEKPMILTDTGGAAEVVVGEDIGLLIPNEYGDVSALDSRLLDELAYQPRNYQITPLLSSAMNRMASQRSAWCQKGKLGREKIMSFYRFDQVVRAYEGVIRAACGVSEEL